MNSILAKNLEKLKYVQSYRQVLPLSDDEILLAYKECRAGDFITSLSLRFMFETLDCGLTKDSTVDSLQGKVFPKLKGLLSAIAEAESIWENVETIDYMLSPLVDGSLSMMGLDVSKVFYAHAMLLKGDKSVAELLELPEAITRITSPELFQVAVLYLARESDLEQPIGKLAGETASIGIASGGWYSKIQETNFNAIFSEALDYLMDYSTPMSEVRSMIEMKIGMSSATLLTGVPEDMPAELGLYAKILSVVMSSNLGILPSSFAVRTMKCFEPPRSYESEETIK